VRTYGITLFPISESKSVVIRSTAEEEHNTENYETEDRKNLDGTEYKLCFSKEGNGDDVEQKNNKQDNGDPNSDGYAFGPVLNNDGGSGDFGGE
jgi:hypothetical protein